MPRPGPPRMTVGWWLFLAAFLGGIAALLCLPLIRPDALRPLEFSRTRLSDLAAEAVPVVAAIRVYRAEHGEYPANLLQLPEAERLGIDPATDEFRADRTWDYLAFRPPLLRTRLSYHTTLTYEFAPAAGFPFPAGVDEGWVRRQEGDALFLGPHAGRR